MTPRALQQSRKFTVYGPPAPNLTSGSGTGESTAPRVIRDNLVNSGDVAAMISGGYGQ